jgi:hypothetical protein
MSAGSETASPTLSTLSASTPELRDKGYGGIRDRGQSQNHRTIECSGERFGQAVRSSAATTRPGSGQTGMEPGDDETQPKIRSEQALPMQPAPYQGKLGLTAKDSSKPPLPKTPTPPEAHRTSPDARCLPNKVKSRPLTTYATKMANGI